MSNQNINKQQPATVQKSITGNFQLQTKIRVIIQQVLAATIRKLSLFGQKIDKFQEYFVTFKERFQLAQRQRAKQQQQMKKIEDIQTNIRRDMNFNQIKFNEQKQRTALSQKQNREQITQIQKNIKSIIRQNQNINAQLSKTKSKFLQYSNIISTLKQEVSWKITKYLQQTADSHTKMKIYSENIKNEYFNMNLIIDKQKQKYDNIILKYQQDVHFRQQTLNKISQISKQNLLANQQIIKLNTKIDDVEYSCLNKIKHVDNKFENRIQQVQKNNSKLANIFKKIDTFNQILDGLKQDIQDSSKASQQKIQTSFKKSKQLLQIQINKTFKQQTKCEKNFDKKCSSLQGKIDKLQDFLLQKMQFIKMQIQSDMSHKTNQMIEQKSKNDQTVKNSSLQQINSKISKMQLQTNKNIARVQNTLKQSISDVKRDIQKTKIDLQQKIQQTQQTLKSATFTTSSSPSSHIPTISSKQIGALNGQINLLRESMKQVLIKISQQQQFQQEMSKKWDSLKKKNEDNFVQFQQKLNNKVEKVMFLVTKMRGDTIIRNQFNDKQIKQLKKQHTQSKNKIQNTWKLLPGISQCLNLILALIFDAEYQHSRIIQDNLPLLSKDIQKFNTVCQGVIYEFKQKKKPGIIYYRHNQIKKTDLVRATFHGFIQIWQQLFEAQFKNKPNYLPKGFYKKSVQKHLRGVKLQKQQTQIGAIKSTGIIQNNKIEPNSVEMNTSFQIRRRKTGTGKDNLIMIMSQQQI